MTIAQCHSVDGVPGTLLTSYFCSRNGERFLYFDVGSMLRAMLYYIIGLREPLLDVMCSYPTPASPSRLLEFAHDIG